MKKVLFATLLFVGAALGSRANAVPFGYPTTSEDMLLSLQQHDDKGKGEQKPPPQKWKRPQAEHNHVGPKGEYQPHPGWHAGWHYNAGFRPSWFRVGIRFPGFAFVGSVPSGYWQCTAFSADLAPVTDVGPDLDQAAYAALYSCGGPDYTASGCYIPDGYCQHR